MVQTTKELINEIREMDLDRFKTFSKQHIGKKT